MILGIKSVFRIKLDHFPDYLMKLWILNLKIKRDLPSRCLIGILPRHQSGTKELPEKHAPAYLVSL